MFVVIEGVDGSGKATQTENVQKELKKRGYSVATISFPSYGEHSSYFVSEFLNGKYGPMSDVNPYVAATFYFLDRFDQSYKLQKLIDNYDYVICDRYTTSNFVHRGTHLLKTGQTEELYAFLDWVMDMEFTKGGLAMPDKVLFLALGMNSVQKLMENKKKENRGYIDQKLDIAESDLEHQKYALEVGKTVLPQYFDGYQLIECEDEQGHILDIDSITLSILKHIIPGEFH